jgi:hypothetical protein
MGKASKLLDEVADALSGHHAKAQFDRSDRCTAVGFVVASLEANAVCVSFRFMQGTNEGTNGVRMLETILGDYMTTLRRAGFRDMQITKKSNRLYLKVV